MTEEPLNGIVVIPTPEDLKYLYNRLAQTNNENHDLDKRILFVIKHNQVLSGCIGARLIWQIEPLWLTPEFDRDASPVTRQRAVFKMIRTMENWLSDPTKNTTKLHRYFGAISNKKMEKVAIDYGMKPAVYHRARLMWKDVQMRDPLATPAEINSPDPT